VLNQEAYRKACVLVAGDNFGCGSSREHAPWALQDYGFRAILAPSYADIFFNTCFKNGVLPVRLQESEIDRLFHEIAAFPGFELVIDLPNQVVRSADGSLVYAFEVEAFRKDCMLNGWDDIGLVLRHADKIRDFEARRLAAQPWLGKSLGA
jgi:3-isopropylmalate/(R)-2-methylmalate dehydratase small subunit